MTSASGPRCVALVGPYLSGKTTLMESLLSVSGGIHRKGSIKEGNTVGDSAAEARARQMSVEISVGSTDYLDDPWTFLDCPGSIEMRQEAINALMVADLAVVVYEPSTERAMTLAPLFKMLADRGIPHMVFINKIDTITEPVSAVYEALRAVEHAPLVLRQIPIRDGETVSGYVDLISGRAYRYTEGAEGSERIDMPDSVADEYEITRESMLEALADFNDELLEKLLEDEVPDIAEIYGYLAEGVHAADVVPVLIGSAEQDFGVRRLLKALRHEVPGLNGAIERLGVETGSDTAAQVFKTYHAQHAGKLSLARVLSGTVSEGMSLNGQRVGSLLSLMGGQQNKIASAGPGAVAALGRMESVRTGDLLTAGQDADDDDDWPEPIGPVYSRAIAPENRNDEVKLTGALQRLNEEDPSVSYEQNADTREMVLWGQGEIHLQVALEKLKGRYNVSATAAPPSVPYKETIRKTISQHGRFKRQTGGHGMFGDVHIDISPRPRGEGFEFSDKIVGGSIPKQFIPAVESGVKEFAVRGPLGFPVVDFGVRLTDGQFHSVDSNEMSFKLAARVAMSEGMPKCNPVLLEPISRVEIDVPTDSTNKVHGLISGRRGQILGFAPKEGWKGWDTVEANIPSSDIVDLIIELRSLSQGVATFRSSFDRLQELTGRLADQVIEARKEAEESN